MATATSSLDSRRSMPSFIRIFTRVILVVLLLLVVASAGAYLWFHSAQRAAMPTLDGQIKVAGLSAPVTVIRDRQGVPHIHAASMEDLFLAQGYVTAQDRLWQMDITRRYAAGELSGALGSRAIETDKAQRVLGLRLIAQQELTRMPEQDRR